MELLNRLLMMGRLAESMIGLAIRALIEQNESLSHQIFEKEQEVNELQLEIDDAAVKLTALQQPVCGDVRFLFMASRIATELERIADQTVNIAHNAHHVSKAPALKPIVDLPLMGEIVENMVRDSLEALISRDCALAAKVLDEEKRVDSYRDQIFRILLACMMADPGTVEGSLALILISRNLERIGDHATNIAEEVIYMVEGREIRHHHESSARASV
jgi:phosphate transport system protein